MLWYTSLVNFLFFNLYVIVVVVGIVFILITFFSLLLKSKEQQAKMAKGKLEISKIGDKYKEAKDYMLSQVLKPKEYKKHKKLEAKEKQDNDNNNIFIVNFKGDMGASQVESLREEVSAILAVANSADEVIVKVESPGGVVNGYGFAAAQLERIRTAGINLTVCVDQVAASGGYMMAAVAHKIICAPFAIVGSIGVVGTVPNIHELLRKNGIDVEMHTSGKFKRTLTTTSENTPEAREKFKQDLQNIHQLFKKHILNYRPDLNMDEVGTGEYWLGKDALDLNLVDKIQTSDDYIISCLDSTKNLYEVQFVRKKEKGFLKSKLTFLKSILTSIFYNRKIL